MIISIYDSLLLTYKNKFMLKPRLRFTLTSATKSSFSISGKKITFSSLEDMRIFWLRIDEIKGEQAPRMAP